MNSDRRYFTTFRNGMAVVVFVLGFMLAPSAVLAQAGWQQQTLPALEPGVTYSLADIKALSPTEAWISGGLGTGEAFVMKTTDGTNWSLIFRKGADANPWISFGPFNRLSLVDSNTAWAGGTNGLTAFTVNGGLDWSREAAGCFPSSPAYPPIHVYALKAVDATNVWTGGWDNSALRGLIWHRPYTGDCTLNALTYYLPYRPESIQGKPILAIDAADANNAWAVLEALGGILHTTDGGDNWTLPTGSPTGGWLYDVAAVNASVAWVVGGGGGIAKTIDGGSTWVVQGSGVTETLNKISAVSADVAWAVGGNGTILKTVDGGATWLPQVSGTSATLVGVAAVSDTTAWVVGDGVLLATTDGGVDQPLSAPGVRDVSPAGGPIAGGTVVAVGGRDFRPGARVYIGGVLAARAYAAAGYEGYVTTPAHAAGFVDVTVVNPDGQSATLANAFAYADTQPLIVRLSPSYGYVDSLAQIDIYGAGLTPANGVYEPVPTVNINGTAVPGVYADYDWVQVVFDRTLLTTAGAGIEDITVTTAAGTSHTLSFAVNYGSVPVDRPYTPPYNKSVTIQSLSGPVQATFFGMNGNSWIRVGKVFEQPGWFGGNSPPSAGYTFLPGYYYDVTTSSTYYQLGTICFPYADADVPAGLSESKLRLMRRVDYGVPWEDVTFTLDTSANVICGTTPVLMTQFAIAQGPAQIPPPAIAEMGIAPAIGPPAGGTTVTISGSLFQPNTAVTFGGVAATNVTVVSGMRITATIPAHDLGFVDVVVTNPDLQSSTVAGGFEYVGPPTVTSVAPGTGRMGGNILVTITGAGFRTGATAKFGGSQVAGCYVVNDTTITGYSPSHALGPVDVVVTNPDGQSGTLVNGFTYVPAPTLTSLVPNAGPVKGGTPVTITGTNFQTGATVTINYTVPAIDVAVINSTTITAVTPARAAGVVTITVTNPDGQSVSRYPGFTYLLGDLNADGVLSILDAIMVLQLLSAQNPVPAVDISADVNNDGAIGMAEAIFILQKAAGIR